jgi:hypothetical protein
MYVLHLLARIKLQLIRVISYVIGLLILSPVEWEFFFSATSQVVFDALCEV